MRHSSEARMERFKKRKIDVGVGMQKKAEKKRKLNRGLYLLCLMGIFMTAAVGSMIVRAAIQSDSDGTQQSVHVQDSEIENATLVIGTHLIHINGLTSELYQTALESANAFNQPQMYYKSELAGGAWFEISDATSIADITTAGTPVSKSVIEALEFTHKTGADGVTVDLRTGNAVSVFDINNPYDLRIMEELEPLKIQYQILQKKTDKNDSDNIYLDMVGSFFDKNIQNSTTQDCDASLQALQNYKNGLSPREKPSQWTEKTEAVMVSVDADRRVVSLTNLAEYLNDLENETSGMGSSNKTEGDDGEESVPPDFIINSEIVAAVGDCIKNVEESISKYEAKRMTDSGDTVSASAEYRYSQELIAKARSSDTPGCDKVMEMLCNLQNILDGVIAQQDSELDTLTSDLVSAAFGKYTSDLRAGVSQDYQTAVSEGASQAVLQKYLSEQKTAANADRLEYQTMLEAQFARMDNQAAQAYTLKLIDGVPQLESSVIEDAAASHLKDTVADHLIWLRKSYADLVKNASDATDMEKLEKEKEDLEKQRQDALDNNDLAGANKLTAQMEAKQKDIDGLAESLNAVLNSPNSSEADKAKAAAGLGDKNAAALLSSMADSLTSAIRSADEETDSSDLQNQMAALAAAAALDPDAAQAALDQVQDALDNAAGLDADAADALAGGLADAKDAAKSGDGSLDADALLELLNSILDGIFGSGGFENASSKQQAAAMIALEWYGEEKGNKDALSLAASLAKQTAQQKNPYVYEKYKGRKEAYMSLQALGKVLEYRYIFDDAHDTVTLQKAKEYYLFTLAKRQYEAEGGTKKNLSATPELMQTLYLKSADSESIFDTKAEYFEKAIYGAVGTPEVETLAEDIYKQLLEGGA